MLFDKKAGNVENCVRSLSDPVILRAIAKTSGTTVMTAGYARKHSYSSTASVLSEVHGTRVVKNIAKQTEDFVKL